MTVISVMTSLAPQPAPNTLPEASAPLAQTTVPVAETETSNLSGEASDQSGQGAGNGSGTGGAQIAALLKKTRAEITVQRPTPESVVEARSSIEPAAAFLERQARLNMEAKAAEEEANAQQAAARAAEAKAAAAKAKETEYVMPNPLPTAPILQRDDA